MADVKILKIGSLVGTPSGIFGVISKFIQEDNRYVVSWAGGMRKGEDVSYDNFPEMEAYAVMSKSGQKLLYDFTDNFFGFSQ